MAKLNPAIRRKEIQLVHSGHIGYFLFFKDTLIKDGEVLALWYHPPVDLSGNPLKIDVFPGVKSFVDVYEEVHGKKPSGPLWETYKWYRAVPGGTSMAVFAPPGSPKEAVEILRKSYQATAEDSDYLAESTKQMGAPLRFISLEQGIKVMKTFRNVSPEMRNVMADMAKVGERN